MKKYHETTINVRFNEIDSYQVAWHGHYVAWMEIGRNDLVGQFGLEAGQIAEAGYLAPVVLLELKFNKPARYPEELKVRTSLKRMETASLEFSSVIIGSDGRKCASGRVVHTITDKNGVLQYSLPPAIRDRIEQLLAWQEGP